MKESNEHVKNNIYFTKFQPVPSARAAGGQLIKNCLRAGHSCERVVVNDSSSCGPLLTLAGLVAVT